MTWKPGLSQKYIKQLSSNVLYQCSITIIFLALYRHPARRDVVGVVCVPGVKGRIVVDVTTVLEWSSLGEMVN